MRERERERGMEGEREFLRYFFIQFFFFSQFRFHSSATPSSPTNTSEITLLLTRKPSGSVRRTTGQGEGDGGEVEEEGSFSSSAARPAATLGASASLIARASRWPHLPATSRRSRPSRVRRRSIATSRSTSLAVGEREAATAAGAAAAAAAAAEAAAEEEASAGEAALDFFGFPSSSLGTPSPLLSSSSTNPE